MATLRPRKKLMQDVKKILIFASLLLFGFTLSLGVDSFNQDSLLKPNNNRGGYMIKEVESSVEGLIEITGVIRDIDTNEALVGTTVKLMCYEVSVDADGKYKLAIPKPVELEYFLECFSLGYKKVQTENLKISDYQSLNLDFFLEEQSSIIYHCDE